MQARRVRHVLRIWYEKWSWRHPGLDRWIRIGLAPVRTLSRLIPGHNPLFDPEWYVAEYDDVRQMRVSPWNHWKRHGLSERRNPNGLFDTTWYIERNSDAADDPLEHYLKVGAAEGKDPSPRFDTAWYLRQYGDVAAAGMNPLVHYLKFGTLERRKPIPPAVTRTRSAGGRRDGGSLLVPEAPVASELRQVERRAAPWNLVARIEHPDEWQVLADVLEGVEKPSRILISVPEDLAHEMGERVSGQPASIVPEAAISVGTVVSAAAETGDSAPDAVFVMLDVATALGADDRAGPARQLLHRGAARQALHLFRSSPELGILVAGCDAPAGDQLAAFWLSTKAVDRRRDAMLAASEARGALGWRMRRRRIGADQRREGGGRQLHVAP